MRRAFLLAVLLAATPAFAQGINVVTQHGDTMRTGANLHESTITLANLNYRQFGKLYDQPVDGQVYAQPLVVTNLQIGGTTHDVVFVATEHDSVYAFDADSVSGSNALPLWHTSFIDPADGITTVSSSDVGSTDIDPEIGITSTPVIDTTNGLLFVVAKTKENGNFFERLHALSLTTGSDVAGSPVVITGTVTGNDGMNDPGNGTVVFDPLTQNERSGLLLLNGVVYLAWSSHGDNNPVHGWVMGYNELTLAQVALFNTTPNGNLGTIWMAGCGLSADSDGNIYCTTGNGTFDTNNKNQHVGVDWGDTLLKISSTGSNLAVVDSFTPANQNTLNNLDLDLGSGGVMLLPDQPGAHPHLGICTGKQNLTFVFDRDNLGGYTAGNKGLYEAIPGAIIGSFGTPAYFNGRIYYHGSNYGGGDVLKCFALNLNNDQVEHSPVSRGKVVFPYPGSTPTISASGTTNGIVWEIENTSPATLIASNAENVAEQLYTSNDAGSRDLPGDSGVKFTVPTVANGKVYIGTNSTLTAFALLSDTTPLTVNVNGPGSVTNGFAGSSQQQTNSALSITATANAGATFVSWTDSNGNLITTSSTYNFAMSENLVLNANFRIVPLPGTYSGLVQSATSTFLSTGPITLTLNSNDHFSATIHVPGRTIQLSGTFDINGQFSTTLQPNGSNPISVSLAIDNAGDVSGTVTDNTLDDTIVANVLLTGSTPSFAGKYTLIFSSPGPLPDPQGSGYGSATVDRFGHVRLSGVLGDGATFTDSATITRAGAWQVYVPLYSGKGAIAGELMFEQTPSPDDIDGSLLWFKPGNPALSGTITTAGSIYNPNANPVVALTSGTLTLGLTPAITDPVTATTTLKLTGTAPLTLSFQRGSGTFTGTFKSDGKSGKYGGALFQETNSGAGYYILSGTSGPVNLQ